MKNTLTIPQNILDQIKESKELVKKAKYREALKIIERLHKKYPKNAYVTFRYAVQYGDQIVSGFDKKATHYKRGAAKLLKPLLKRMKEIPFEERIALRNEYYWFSSQPKKQFLLGKSVVKSDPRGNYSLGVGAWCIARNYALSGKPVLAKRWANRSCIAWLEYFKYRPDYYNAWSWYARPLGYLGQNSEMKQALTKAMKLSGKPITFLEFQEVINDNKTLLSK